jgi:hypothetical protein
MVSLVPALDILVLVPLAAFLVIRNYRRRRGLPDPLHRDDHFL